MDKEKKQELIEKGGDQWRTEKHVCVDDGVDWQSIKDAYNSFNVKYRRVFMLVSDRVDLNWWTWCLHWVRRCFRAGFWSRWFGDGKAVIHHRSILNFYKKVALLLDVSLERAVEIVVDEPERVVNEFDIDKEKGAVVSAVEQSGTPSGVMNRKQAEETVEEMKEVFFCE